MGDLLRFDTCIYTNKRSKTLTQHNCFDNVLHILLKQNMDIAAIKAVKFRSLLELYQTWSSSKKERGGFLKSAHKLSRFSETKLNVSALF